MGYQARPDGGIDLGKTYPDLLARRALSERTSRPLSVVNGGIGGNELLRARHSPSVLQRLDTDVFGQPALGSVILLIGINDIARPPFPGTRELTDGLLKVVNRLHARGVRVVLGTIPPAGPSRSAVREAVNRWIRGSGVADAVVDFEAILRAGPRSQHLAPASTAATASTRTRQAMRPWPGQ